MLRVMIANDRLTVEPSPPPLSADDHNRHLARVAEARAASLLSLRLAEHGHTSHPIPHVEAVRVWREALRTYMASLHAGGLR